jgi:hypothetical protein
VIEELDHIGIGYCFESGLRAILEVCAQFDIVFNDQSDIAIRRQECVERLDVASMAIAFAGDHQAAGIASRFVSGVNLPLTAETRVRGKPSAVARLARTSQRSVDRSRLIARIATLMCLCPHSCLKRK